LGVAHALVTGFQEVKQLNGGQIQLYRFPCVLQEFRVYPQAVLMLGQRFQGDWPGGMDGDGFPVAQKILHILAHRLGQLLQ
jgi:hypothetical protein